MSPNVSPRKRFGKFLTARRHRLRRPDEKDIYLERLRSDPKAFLKAAAAPLGFLLLYAALFWGGAFSFLYRGLHAAAWAVWILWIFLALRSIIGFWPRWAHARFATIFVLLIGFGSSWGGWGAGSVKAWVTPPLYARLLTISLSEAASEGRIEILTGSVVHVSLPAGDEAARAFLGNEEKILESLDGEEPVASFPIAEDSHSRRVDLIVRRGWHRIGLWRVKILPDAAPRIAFIEEPEITARKTIRFAYEASDDYGVESVAVRVTPPSGREPVEIPLASPGIKQVRGADYADLTSLPWAGISVTVQLVAIDGAGRKSLSAPKTITLPTRVFRNPFARALIEEREKLLGRPEPSVRDEAANVMAGIARQQGLYRGDPVVLMALRSGAVRLVINEDPMTIPAVQDVLWQTALRLEEGRIGLVRAELASAERDLSSALMRRAQVQDLEPFLARMAQALAGYFDALEAERAKQPPALEQVDWFFANENEALAPEDAEARLAALVPLLERGEHDVALAQLGQLQTLIENLRTTPPELTPDQYKLVQQTTALRALVRGQKALLEETAKLVDQESKTFKGRKKLNDGATRILSQQQLLLSALRDALSKIEPPTTLEAKAGEKAMVEAVHALQQRAMAEVRQKQAEALALMENSLLALSEKMRQSLTARAP